MSANRGGHKRRNLALDDIADIIEGKRAHDALWDLMRTVAGRPSVTQAMLDTFSRLMRDVGAGLEASEKWVRAMQQRDAEFDRMVKEMLREENQ